ncbi:MAG TPA: Druantia anti-phage system protein DruA [Chthoniobacterales bacterium]|nr:Druantia anti-phage system protein DruA [Chthoniobacterales bacterium]
MELHPTDISKLASRVIPINPTLIGNEQPFRSFCDRLRRGLRKVGHLERSEAIRKARAEVANWGRSLPTDTDVAFQFACSVVLDVVAQGWDIALKRDRIELRSPSTQGITRDELKDRVRQGHLIERNAQLRENPVREFIAGMEQRRFGPGGWTSIYSLMRDGRELARQLGCIAEAPAGIDRVQLLRKTVSPYLQLVEPEVSCQYTGIKLTDIWRYFRHTWVSAYKPLPGRNMMLLIRDAAHQHHPIVGIAALGSSMAQQTVRDQWIGWEPDTFLRDVEKAPSLQVAKWVHNSVDRLIKSLFVEDLITDKIVNESDLINPAAACIQRLQADAKIYADEHRRSGRKSDHKFSSRQIDWKGQALTPLFRSKRSKTLAALLTIRAGLQLSGFVGPTVSNLRRVLADTGGKSALRQLVRFVKAEHVGVDMMDIIVCGSVSPYNHLLGGKLVALLLASPQTVQFYRARYGAKESVIASSMAGRPVRRSPNLVLLATTSLYGVNASQYNRIRVPLERLGKDGPPIEYRELGMSKGYGSYHFSQSTIEYLEALLGRFGQWRRVNSIFGEGVNPLMRKIRDGLDGVGLPSDDLLTHGNPRVVYVLRLAYNLREVLLGFESKPKYLLGDEAAEQQTELLAEYWRQRWLIGRITKPDVLPKVASHTLSYPVSHGARVSLPPTADEERLFD